MLNKLHLKNYGKHTDTTVEFKPGINCIVGANRRGKTQILESICFALYGKTNNSLLNKVISFGAEKAEVELMMNDIVYTRTRTEKGSSIDKKLEQSLTAELNLDYKEFLELFYISSGEQKTSLFDSTYCRNFLIEMFNLYECSKIYEQLKTQYQTLCSVKAVEPPKIDRAALEARLQKGQEVLNSLQLDKIQEKLNLCYEVINKISLKENDLNHSAARFKRELNLLGQDKCGQCGQNIDPVFRQAFEDKVRPLLAKIDAAKTILAQKRTKVVETQTKLTTAYTTRSQKQTVVVEKMAEIRAELNQKPVLVDTVRLKELETVLPVFSPKGFPSYLLQIYIPVLVETTNGLVQTIFPDLGVYIRTEKPDSNIPDFKVMINKVGSEVPLSLQDLCGSERVLVNLCFRLGFIIMMKQMFNIGVDFYLIDEGFEKMDDENSVQVVKLLEKFAQQGYIKQVLLVTHKTILKEQPNLNYIEL